MYCYNCGSQLYNGMSKCMFCHTDMQLISEVIFDYTVGKIIPSCPKFDIDNEISFQIGSHPISVCKENRLAIALNSFINQLFENSWNELVEWIHQKSFNTIVKSGAEELRSLSESILLDTAAFLRGAGCDIDSNYMDNNFAFMLNVSYLMEPIYEIAAEFGEAKEMMDIARKNAATPRTSHWVGGGFGLGGALKGTAVAGALNLGGEAVNGMKNFLKSQITDWYTRSLIEKGKDEVKRSQEFLLGIKEIWKEHLMSLHKALITLMPSELKINDFRPLYNWGEELQFKFSSCSERDAIHMLITNLYDVNAYINLYLLNREYGNTLSEIADYCGILDIVGNAFAQYGDKEIITTMDESALGYDTPYKELEELMQRVDRLETHNPIYQHISSEPLVVREQRYAKKIRLLFSLSKISAMQDYIVRLQDQSKLLDIAETIVARNDYLEIEILRKILSDLAEGDTAILDKLESKGNLFSDLTNEIRLSIEISKGNLNSKEANPKIKYLADRELPLAMCMLGEFYLASDDKAKQETGVNYIKKAARCKVTEAMSYVGDWYRLGKYDFPKDKELAEYYLSLAAEMNDSNAKKSLSELKGGKR